jgi:hypothetical protein
MNPKELIVKCYAKQEEDMWVAVCLDFCLATQGVNQDENIGYQFNTGQSTPVCPAFRWVAQMLGYIKLEIVLKPLFDLVGNYFKFPACNPHSFLAPDSHHQRPARSC